MLEPVPVAPVKDTVDTLLSQLGAEEAGPDQRLHGRVSHTAGVLSPHSQLRVSSLHVHHKAAICKVGSPTYVE